jgi:hypothetical protein
LVNQLALWHDKAIKDDEVLAYSFWLAFCLTALCLPAWEAILWNIYRTKS